MDFNSQLSRMKSLMTYGNQVNENAKSMSTCSLEYKAQAADGKTYGIIRECSKYYIKAAEPERDTLAESYQYIGGFNNKKDYEYASYANALKQLELKLASINEACEGKVNISTLNPFRANEALIEGTKRMKNEIARQRQIMYNASMLMNESAGIGSTPITSQPESEHANSGDKDAPFTQDVKADMTFDGKNAETPKAQGDPFDKGEKSSEKAEKGKDVQVDGSVAGMKPTGGKVARVNESIDGGTEYDPSELKSLLEDNVVTFTYIKKDGSLRHARGTRSEEIMRQYGVPMPANGEQPEGMIKYIELEEGMVSDKDMKVGRFWKTCFEDRVESIEEVVSVEDILNGSSDNAGDETEADVASDIAGLDEEHDDMTSVEDAGDEIGSDEIDDEELDALDSLDEEDDDELDVTSDGDNELDLDSDNDEDGEEEELDLDSDDDEDEEEELDLDSEDEDDDELDLDSDDDEYEDDEELDSEDGVDETDPESIRAEIERLQSLLTDLDGDATDTEDAIDGEDTVDGEDAEGDGLAGETVDGEVTNDEPLDGEGGDDEEIEECGDRMLALQEIARKVADRILKEENLNVFGKHPGYRKKPVDLPETGSDANEHGKDINDKSAHNQEPFGQSKGDSKPYANAYEKNALAMQITEKIMSDIKKKTLASSTKA